MSHTLDGAIVGSVIGVLGTVAAGIMAARAVGSQRSDDQEIAQIANTVAVLDAWAELGNVLLGALSEREGTGKVSESAWASIDRAHAKLRESARIWDWSVELIPGTEARELYRMCLDILMGAAMLDEIGAIGPGHETPGEQIARLGELQRAVRAHAAERVEDLSSSQGP